MTNLTEKQIMKYTCQCTRCDGKGKYDRGVCFGCKGTGARNQAGQPRGLTPFVMLVTYSNGSTNQPKVWASSKARAVEIVERMLRIKGWDGVVS